MVLAPARVDLVTAYARSVADGATVVGRPVRLACERHLRDLERGPARGLHFDAEAAERAVTFFGFLRHSKGEWAGQPFELSDWQAFIVGSLFGWKRADGTRRFREGYLEVARKNGKTTMLAGIGLLLAFFDDEPGAEVYAAATKREQAKICWGEARRMVQATPALRRRISVLVGNLHDERTHSKFEPLGADADSMDGLNISGAIGDELHAHKTRGIVDVLETATAARRQPMIVYITTAGHDRHSVCWQKREYALKVLQGVIEDDTVFAYIATIDEGDDWTDPKVWAKANPNLGISVKLDDLERKCRAAIETPSNQNAFKRLHLDIWTEQVSKWLTLEVWDRCAGPVDAEALRGRECYGGLDLASTTDLAALALLFPREDGGFDELAYFWVPEEGLRKRVERDRVPYDVWERQGFIRATEGNVIDYAAIFECLTEEVAARFKLVDLGYDPWNATQLITQLMGEGLTCVPIRQGFASLSAPTKEFEKLVLAGRLRHGGNPVLRWMASNVAAASDPAGNIKPDKAKSADRIDGIVATIMALDRATRRQAPARSAYEDRGLMTV